MFNHQTAYSDTTEREKLRILQALNSQIESMALKLDQIVSHVEEAHFKIPQTNRQVNIATAASTIATTTSNDFNSIKTNNISNLIILPASNFDQDKIIKLNSDSLTKDLGNQPTHILITINDVNPLAELQPITATEMKAETLRTQAKKPKKLKSSTLISNKTQSFVEPASKPYKAPDTTAKRNKQQRQFNTFVRESINSLLGPDFMRTHDVQDIDSQVMEMIRKEAVEHYLPENIRPRRAWHLAKASLRTLKRTLNNRK